ncbi:MAG: redoxin domain-containing protein [Kofleriaceae bacterium]
MANVQTAQESQKTQPRPTRPIERGSKAPDFSLPSTPDQKVSLTSLLETPVVLVFYPADWSPVCGDQLSLYNELHDEWRRHRTQIIGISVDGPWCHLAYAENRRLHFPLLSDFEPKGDVARRYGVYRYDEGVAERALYLIDRDGTVAWSHLSPVGVNPGADGILDALEALEATHARARAGGGQ